MQRPLSVDIKRTIRGYVPRLPYERMTHAVLGERYELSVVLCGDALASRINREHRKKSYSPNVLSFPLSKESGEIFLNVHQAAREARKLGVTHTQRLALLFVHGLFHLKGLAHGRTMEDAEHTILRAFSIVK